MGKKVKHATVALVFDDRDRSGELIPRATVVEIEESDDKYAILAKAERYCKEEHSFKHEVKNLPVVGSDFATFYIEE